MRGMFAGGAAALAGLLTLGACGEARSDVVQNPEPRRWTPERVASPGYESSPTFSPDGQSMIFLKADAAFAAYQLARSRCVDGRYSAPEPLSFGRPAPVSDADPFLSPDGGTLYFISTREAAAEDFDIWSATRTATGWADPARLPAPVNSSGSELLPRMDGAGRLYFGSDRPGGLGGGDIYMATGSGTEWTVENVGPPVSTPAYEYEAEISRDGNTMVVVADREGKSHLYLYRRIGGRWTDAGKIKASETEFQVGPTLSPKADRLIFSQRDGPRSGEMFLIDLVPDPDTSWPPRCR